MPTRVRQRRTRRGTLQARRGAGAEPALVAAETPDLVELLERVAQAADATIAGLSVLARHAASGPLGALAGDVTEEMRGVVSTVRFVEGALGGEPQATRRSTCQRLRWEWLASTGALLDGSPVPRLRSECLATLARATEAAERLADAVAGGQVPAALRVADQLCERLRSAGERLGAAVPPNNRDLATLRARVFATT